MSVKKLKLTANLRMKGGQVLIAGLYEGDKIPADLLAEFQKGSGIVEEISVIPSVKAPVTPTAPAPEPLAETPVKPPAKPAARKTSAKGRRTAKKTSRK